MGETIRVGTRGSKLAVSQTHWALDYINSKLETPFNFEVKTIHTSGDSGNLAVVGAFVKEVEIALLNNEVDLAIHSLKDMPAQEVEGLSIAAIPIREEVEDVLITRNNTVFADLKQGATIGTGSLRRIYQLKNLRPDLKFIEIRGNIFTRIQKVLDSELDAVILAKAGLKRCNIEHYITQEFSIEELVPAVAQGALAIQTRSADTNLIQLLKAVHCLDTELCIKTERAFLKTVGGGCKMPLGALANVENNIISVVGFLSNPTGNRYATLKIAGEISNPEKLGEHLANTLLDKIKDES
jgi:hydroxymethylbilane synthase